MEKEIKFKMISTGEMRDGDHLLYGLTIDGVIWQKTKLKGWELMKGPVVFEEAKEK